MTPADGVRRALSWALGHVVPKNERLFVFGGRHYGGNTAPLFERCNTAGLEGVWLTSDSKELASGRRGVVGTRSLRGLWIAARAGGVVMTHTLGDFDPLRFPSRRTRLFNAYHGMPIKRISRADPGFFARPHAARDLREIARYEGMFATSPQMAAIFSETFGLPRSRVHATGQPRTDALFGAPEPLASRYAPPLPAHRHKVLYCPTWREGRATRLFPFADRDLSRLQHDLERLDAVLFVRTHPSDQGKLARRSGRIVPMQRDVVGEVTAVLAAFDVLVTDYSSVYYDWLLLDRPTIFLPYDLDAYTRTPGFYLPFEEVVSGPCPETQGAFERALAEALTDPSAHSRERAEVRRRVHAHGDGHATDRVLRVLASPRCDRRPRGSPARLAPT